MKPMNPRTLVSTADTKPPLPDCALPKSTTQGDCAGAGIPGSKGRKYTPEEIRKRLLELGGRDARPNSPEGVQVARIGILSAEAGLSLGPVTEADIQQAPELAIVKAITGTAASQNEAAKILESAKVNENGNRNGNRIRTALSSPSERVETGKSNIQVPRPNAEPNPFVKEGIRGYNSKYD